MKRNQIRDLALTSVFAAIILVMTFVPSLGYILVGITELTLIHIPVLIGVFLLPKRYAIVLGLIFWIRIDAKSNSSKYRISYRIHQSTRFNFAKINFLSS